MKKTHRICILIFSVCEHSRWQDWANIAMTQLFKITVGYLTDHQVMWHKLFSSAFKDYVENQLSVGDWCNYRRFFEGDDFKADLRAIHQVPFQLFFSKKLFLLDCLERRQRQLWLLVPGMLCPRNGETLVRFPFTMCSCYLKRKMYISWASIFTYLTHL